MKEEFKRQFEEQGFVILKKVFTEEKLQEIRKLQDNIVRYADKNLEDPFLLWSLEHRNDQGVLYDLYQRHPEFQEMAKNKEILDCLESVLGENIYLYDNSLVYKPKGKRNAVAWHQDFISRPHEPLKIIVWMALDDVTKENGTVQVIPGSHKQGHLPWHRVNGETHHDRVNMEFVEKDRDKIVYAELEAGDVLLFNMLVLHGSDEVHTDTPRRVYRCSYQSMEKKIFTPRQSPIVMRGGSPEFLEKYYNKPQIKGKKKPFIKRAINKIGRILANYGGKTTTNKAY
ncbi:phytanoyl-CoA dioxygenase family protein [Aliarcobacter cryaerophilus]|uniref:phytanoyl-CoA dioxygenase family protein n=1 Tax=Aliarcobacter cryaerophilus TaxID=28198 RepID=UPI0021B5B93A|nr:phytanoyl-CoA dioxygenase family protein [Aliarcobacter cryaerophilus]MCT7520526.1 phytanoyl-CoA dioxygenase family protein [Aliarcobacter cryaerophilus]